MDEILLSNPLSGKKLNKDFEKQQQLHTLSETCTRNCAYHKARQSHSVTELRARVTEALKRTGAEGKGATMTKNRAFPPPPPPFFLLFFLLLFFFVLFFFPRRSP